MSWVKIGAKTGIHVVILFNKWVIGWVRVDDIKILTDEVVEKE